MIEPISFLWNRIFTFDHTRVRPQCNYSILGRISCHILCHISMTHVTWIPCHISMIHVTFLWFMSHSMYVPRYSIMNESCHIFVKVVSHFYEWVMSHLYDWVVSHIWMSHVTFLWMSHMWMRHVTHMNESYHTYECVMLHIWMRHVTYMNGSCHSYEWVMSHVWWVMSHI